MNTNERRCSWSSPQPDERGLHGRCRERAETERGEPWLCSLHRKIQNNRDAQLSLLEL